MPQGTAPPLKMRRVSEKWRFTLLVSARPGEAPFTYTSVVGLVFIPLNKFLEARQTEQRAALSLFTRVINQQMAHRSPFPAAVEEGTHSFILCGLTWSDDSSLSAQLEFCAREVKVFPHGMHSHTLPGYFYFFFSDSFDNRPCPFL